jgi:aspartate kinase
MIVYKFGGASVRSAAGIKNLASIVSGVNDNLFIVVSAMGKTTNALEGVLEDFMQADHASALAKFQQIENYHNEILAELFPDTENPVAILQPLYDEITSMLQLSVGDNYDRWYDKIVSYGEIISTQIVSKFLNEAGIQNRWLDMRKLLITDSNFREANVKMKESQQKLTEAVNFENYPVYIGQGFIGANTKGDPTTLGREGSDYTAAVVANLLNAENLTIWKDVPGILNADPRLYPQAMLVPELTYSEAVELAYSGAQVIHPKTIKPLQNKNIPLYVRPFGNPSEKGSVIKAHVEKPAGIPFYSLLKNQVLVTIRPIDFSFVLEENLPKIFSMINKHRLKVSMIESSAISISVAIGNSRYLPAALDELSNEFDVSYNENLELLTVRGISDEIAQEVTNHREVLLMQRTRRIGRFLMKER